MPPLMEATMIPHILLVDDDRATLFALSELLQRRLGNVTIDTATSIESALRLLRSTIPNIIVSDVLMPGCRWHDVSLEGPATLSGCASDCNDGTGIRKGTSSSLWGCLCVPGKATLCKPVHRCSSGST